MGANTLPQCDKFVMVTAPAAIIDDASLTTTEIDTKGYDYCRVLVVVGATDIALTALSMTESDSAGSGHAAISGLDFDGDTDIDGSTAALPSATDDNNCFAFEIDLRGRKRYLDVTATVGNGTAGGFVSVFALLSRGDELLQSVSNRGYGGVLRV